MGKEADGGSMDGREHDMKKGLFSIFYNMALFLYKKACTWGLPLFSSRQVEADLMHLEKILNGSKRTIMLKSLE